MAVEALTPPVYIGLFSYFSYFSYTKDYPTTMAKKAKKTKNTLQVTHWVPTQYSQ